MQIAPVWVCSSASANRPVVFSNVTATSSRGCGSAGSSLTGPSPRLMRAVCASSRTCRNPQRLNGPWIQLSDVTRRSGGGGVPCMSPSSGQVAGRSKRLTRASLCGQISAGLDVQLRTREDRHMEDVDVLIVGAGITGIGTGYYLTTRLPGHSFAILEG